MMDAQVLGQLDTGRTHRTAAAMVLEYIEGGVTSLEYLEFVDENAGWEKNLCRVLGGAASGG